MKTNKTRIAMTISMPRDMAEEYDKLARQMSKNKSVLFREMFLAYKRQTLEKEFRELQTYGTALGRQRGLFTESDVEKLVYQGR
jgi:predicted DNA-binding protein